ncbi:hypothetical protein Mgra_00009776 [Meloidogyne graminicola]|uniref:Uncharacterized protein n=1 Tax=Meloidogyne graminicola TaxID=189291 RepID=A0A8S9ZD86_9BILA|nr:hypothetical protein Mgra_00009776 [Meloidogyne graminicola]
MYKKKQKQIVSNLQYLFPLMEYAQYVTIHCIRIGRHLKRVHPEKWIPKVNFNKSFNGYEAPSDETNAFSKSLPHGPIQMMTDNSITKELNISQINTIKFNQEAHMGGQVLTDNVMSLGNIDMFHPLYQSTSAVIHNVHYSSPQHRDDPYSLETPPPPPLEQRKKIKVVMFTYIGVMIDYNSKDKYFNIQNTINENPQLLASMIAFERGHFKLTQYPQKHISIFGYILAKNDTLELKNSIVDKAINLLYKNGGYQICVLNNSGFYEKNQTIPIIEEDNRFNHLIHSCHIGHRTTDFNFFKIVLNKCRVRPDECVFLSDVEENCLAANEVGIYSIQR